jgi:hypothetical protein
MKTNVGNAPDLRYCPDPVINGEAMDALSLAGF